MTQNRYCPECNVDLRGGPIDPKHFIHSDTCDEQKKRYNGRCFCLPYGDKPEDQRFYSRVVGVEVRGTYDGTLFWQCPDCEHHWHRWPKGHGLYKATESLWHDWYGKVDE